MHHARASLSLLRPQLLCFHSFGSKAGQYRALEARLADRFEVAACDFYGHGGKPCWAESRRFTLADEAAPFEALLRDERPVHLIGHSYGAAVALRFAAARRAHVRSMTLYEPAIWGTLSQLCPGEPATREIEAMRDETIGLLDADRHERAAELFIDYWSGSGSWSRSSAERRRYVLSTLRSLRDVWLAAFDERWTQPALGALEIPCLLITGTCTTRAARRAVDLLRDALPRACIVEHEGLDHLAPITHPESLITPVEAFLARVA